jgi:hypothetical protein
MPMRDDARSERAVIFTMARNLSLDALRRRTREEKALEPWELELPGRFEPAADHEALIAALAELPEEQRSVVHLHVWEEDELPRDRRVARPAQPDRRQPLPLCLGETPCPQTHARMKTDVEQSLRTLRWRDPPPEFLKHTLEVALAESRQRLGVLKPSGALREPEDSRKRRRAAALQDALAPRRKRRVFAWLAFIPRPLRLPLAACWLLAFYFRLTTPEAIPQNTLRKLRQAAAGDARAASSPISTETERLAHEFLEQRRGPIPTL